ncbi:MAG: hypothetical protein IKI62_04320 [Clostridia bacterium]|nr:hypothetical protein [Clostridia bacterium]
MAIFNCNFTSYTLKRDVEINVIIPTMTILPVLAEPDKEHSHEISEPYPVLYLLHGFANNRNSWFNYTSLPRYAEERRIAVVTVSGENKAYSEVGQDNFFKFINKELPEFVKTMFPISKKKEDTYIAGLSMGGFGTLLHGLSAPENFCAMGPLSAGIHKPGTSERANLFELAEKVVADGKQFPKIYMACGCKDRLYDINVEFRDHLIKLGADVTWDEMPEYAHEWPFWDEQIKRFLDWIPRTDCYSKLPMTGV